MTDSPAPPFAHANFSGPIHTLIQIGANSLGDIEDALTLDPAQVVVTTLDPDLVPKAENTLAPRRSADRVARIDHMAVTAKRGGPAQVQLFQQPTLASFKKPTGLQALCPDLIPERQVTVPTVNLSAFFKSLPALPEDARHMLWLGLTGDEHTLLGAMGGRFVQRFHDVVISLPATALFERAPTETPLLQRLYDLGFLPLARREGLVPGIAECHMIKSPHHAELQARRAAEAEQETQKARIKALTQEKMALQKALDQIALDAGDLQDLRNRYASLMADYEAQSDALRQVQARIKAAVARVKT